MQTQVLAQALDKVFNVNPLLQIQILLLILAFKIEDDEF